MSVQAMRALSVANKMRADRSELKKRIKARKVSVAAIVLARPPEAENMPVSLLLLSQPGWGKNKTHRFLKSLSMSEFRTVGELTYNQRQRIVGRVAGGDAAVRDALELEEDRLLRWAA